MILTTSSHRFRSVLITFKETDIADLETAYNAYEVTEAGDITKTKQTLVKSAGFDGEKYWIIAETIYPEYTDDNSQVPAIP